VEEDNKCCQPSAKGTNEIAATSRLWMGQTLESKDECNAGG
jgi:hypothetical protein